ncbi:MAG: CoA pyrophosphatase [Gammaproteobacteria bacterium]|nr:CoA pyrophosphatase [Gammaproteobacteria bacterium]MDP7296044.1 CoA pyrophosphatase [Gammaproteobacteria bacterium]MDP7418632.1 CoA pyrophosphatase [Gammaproteobacteria bacterium]MDP7661461.1 CoA pyrophosphatase [Gammaproteobacteria bacterium]HJP38665.1 CoA pyrophosphatase [Gammaproteobacteria bacterium]
MKQLIERRFRNTKPPADPVGAALARLPDGVAGAWFSQPLIKAAVLVPLIERESRLSVLLTQRTEHLDDHPGQISFPGGRAEPADAGPRQTALREAREEIGLADELVSVVGYLDALAVVTGFVVTPVVGFVAADAEFTVDPFEVAEIFEVPLEFFMDDMNHRLGERNVNGYTLPFSEYHFEHRRIWGATAKIISDFIKTMKNKEISN